MSDRDDLAADWLADREMTDAFPFVVSVGDIYIDAPTKTWWMFSDTGWHVYYQTGGHVISWQLP